MELKEMVAPGKKVTFESFSYPEFWYVTEDGFKFRIPIADAKDAIFRKEDKAIFFMRWIRKEIEWLAEQKKMIENARAYEAKLNTGG